MSSLRGSLHMDFYFPGDYKTYIDAVWDWHHYGYQLEKYNKAVETYDLVKKEKDRLKELD